MLGHGGPQARIAAVAKHEVESEEQRGRARIVELLLLLVAHPELERHSARAPIAQQLLRLLLVALPPQFPPYKSQAAAFWPRFLAFSALTGQKYSF